MDYTDPAYEEYLSTGIDPTGGELGPDFDPETGEPLCFPVNVLSFQCHYIRQTHPAGIVGKEPHIQYLLRAWILTFLVICFQLVNLFRL